MGLLFGTICCSCLVFFGPWTRKNENSGGREKNAILGLSLLGATHQGPTLRGPHKSETAKKLSWAKVVGAKSGLGQKWCLPGAPSDPILGLPRDLVIRRTAQIFVFFFPLPLPFSLFFSLLHDWLSCEIPAVVANCQEQFYNW